MKKLLSTLTLATLIFAPLTASAATPTAAQIIRADFKNRLTTNAAETVTMDFAVNYNKVYFDKTKPTDTAAFKLIARAENFPVNDTLSNAEINYTVPQLLVKTDGETMVDSKDSLSFDARVFTEDKTIYLRLAKLDPQAVSMLSSVGIEVEPIMGQWVKLSLKDLTSSNLDSEQAEALEVFSNEDELKKIKAWYVINELKLGSPISIVSQGRITKNAAGEKMQTARVKINSKWYAAVEKMMVEQYKANHFDATKEELKTAQADAKTSVAAIKKVLDKTTVDIQVNLTTAKIAGVSVKYKQTETNYRYDYVEVKGKYTEKKIADSKDTLDLQMNMNWSAGSGSVLEVPTSALDAETVWDLIYKRESEAVLNTPQLVN